MSRIGNNGTGKTDYYGSLGSILTGFFTGQVASGLNVAAQGSPNMSVKVNPGIAMIPTGTGATASASLVRNDTSTGENVTITTASGSNPRKDVVVAYYDETVIDATNVNNPTSLKFMAVAGTPNATPSAPNDATIQSAVGASNPWIKLAEVLVGTGVTQITNGNITDLRTLVRVPNTKWTNNSSFRAYCSASITMPTGAFTLVPINTVAYDLGGNFDTANRRFVATIPGTYHFDARFAPASTAVQRVVPCFFVNGIGDSRGTDIEVNGSSIVNRGATISADIYLNVGDFVDFRTYVSPATGIDPSASQTYFSGHLVSPR